MIKMNNLIFLQVMSPASAHSQMTLLRQRPSKERPDPKQKLSRKGGEKGVGWRIFSPPDQKNHLTAYLKENIAPVRTHSWLSVAPLLTSQIVSERPQSPFSPPRKSPQTNGKCPTNERLRTNRSSSWAAQRTTQDGNPTLWANSANKDASGR